MQAAPATSLVCDDGGAWRRVCAALTGLACAVPLHWLAGWVLPSTSPGAHAPAAALLGLVVAAALLRRRPPPARLAWDGRQWRWWVDGAAVCTGQVQVVLDLGGWMLLRLEPQDGRGRPGRRRWWPVGAAQAAPARAALYAGSHQDPQRPASGRAV